MRETLGHYRVLEQIGSGGMGVVYLARDERLEREVAIKVLSPDSLADDDARRRFRREALALSRLNHPNIATIHDFDTFDGVDALVMEYIPGASLDETIQRSGALPEHRVSEIGLALAAALEAAHERGVVHRDLKPGNVRLTPDGRIKVLDFGIARALRAEPGATTVTATGSVFAGTLPYMAPEQLTGRPADARTDIYAAGTILYELATGTRLYPDLSGARLLGAILDTAPPLPRRINPRVSPELERIIGKALEKDPDLRYQSARELAIDLRRLTPTAIQRVHPSLPSARRRRFLGAALALVVMTLTGWVVYHRSTRPSTFVPRGTMAIADFTNATSDAPLADAIRTGLTVQLQQSPYGDVVSRERVFDALRRMRRPTTALDPDTLRELCVREGIPILLTGDIQRRGEVTRVDARAVVPASGTVLFNEFVQFRNESETFDNIDALARAVRRRLGEPLSGIEQHNEPLARVTTRSLEGLEQYSRGADLFARGDTDAALPCLRAALAVDPDFAMAHRLLARVYETVGDRGGERQHLARAYELRQNLTERERRHVEASYFRGEGQYERAVEALTALTTLYPDDGEARYDLAVAYRDAGDLPKAVKALEATIARSPHVTAAYGELLLLLARTGRYARGREISDQADRRGIDSARVTWGRGMLLLGEGRVNEARAAFVRLESDEVFANAARLYQVTADTYEGKLEAAVRRLQADILLDQKGRNVTAENKRHLLLARIALLRHDMAEAMRQARFVAERDAASIGPVELQRAAGVLAQAGDRKRAAALVARLDAARTSLGSAFASSCYYGAAGELALTEGQPRRAIELFRQGAAEYWRPVISQGLARAYEGVDDWKSAREEWKRVLASAGEIFYEGFAADWVTGVGALARAEQRAGDVVGAQREYTRFLTLWRGADDLPVLRNAVREARRLGATAEALSPAPPR
jgi:eukaryotic-like serine/threonine-protein kinase